MYRNTRFGELMKGLSRPLFERTVAQHAGDKHTKGFRCWDHLLAMVYAQLSGCGSLRELEAGFNSQSACHYHLGTRCLRRSTLADANRTRRSELFGELCRQLLAEAGRKTKREVKDLLYLLDSTPIPLKGRGFDEWTADSHNHRTRGLKMHLLYDLASEVPVQMTVTAANVNDIDEGRQLPVDADVRYVFDKGYCDYSWWYRLHEGGARFVTRLKKNAGVKPIESRLLSADAVEAGVLEDTVVLFKHRRPGGKRVNAYYGTPLRRIVVARPDKEAPLVLVSNDVEGSVQAIAEGYKRRWGIELFFKWLKQNLSLKRFVGRSENAVRIQIYTALIAYLLVHGYHRRQQASQSLKLWLVEIRVGLFQRPESEHLTVRKRRQEDALRQQMQGVLAL